MLFLSAWKSQIGEAEFEGRVVSDSIYLNVFYHGSSFSVIGAYFNELFQCLYIPSHRLFRISGVMVSISVLRPMGLHDLVVRDHHGGLFVFSGSGYHLGEDEGFGLRLLSSSRPIWGGPGWSAAASLWCVGRPSGRGAGVPWRECCFLRAAAHIPRLVRTPAALLPWRT